MTSKLIPLIPLIPLILSLTSITIAGCDGPCGPVINGDTIVIPNDTACAPSDVGTSSTGDTDTTTDEADMGTTVAECLPPPKAPTCANVPAFGAAWGPCLGGTCNDGSACKVTGQGNVCLPACDGEGCECAASLCLGGECNGAECRPSCFAVGDPCPLPGMVCDYNAGDPLCVHKAQ